MRIAQARSKPVVNMSGKRNLFDENSDEDDENLELTVNNDYARRYEEWREAEIKRKLEDRYGNADESISSSSSDDDDDPEELKRVMSKDFFEVISSLKTRDPKIYNPEVKFFKNEKEQKDFDPLEKKNKKKEDKDKPLYLRDYERKLITEHGGELSDEDSDSESKVSRVRSQSPSYVEEQLRLRESLRKAVDDNSDEESDLLIKKEKSKEEKRKEEEDYIEWLKGEEKIVPDAETVNTLKPLQALWNDPKLDDGEKFLKDYVLNKRYLEKDDQPLNIDNLSEDEYQEEYLNQFERKFNFRFEEPDKDFLKRYPRTMDQSLRKKDTRRKEKREAVKLRKEEEKKRKKEELKVLKALKRKEILKKIEKIKAITGNDELGINPDELEDDFDPEAHDRKMKELFNDDYYQGAEDAEDEDELQLPPLEEELLDDNMNWDEWDGTDRNEQSHTEGVDADNIGGPYCEDPDFNMDCDFDPATQMLCQDEKSSERKSAREKRKLKRQSRFGRLVRKEKPVFDPNDKTFEQYVDEYYGMDYEDLIGDIPCRFKYKTVVPNSYGLTIEEILAADDKELNQWASIKKAYTIRPDHVEKNEAKVYAQKAQNEELKRKILPSLYRHDAASNDESEEGKSKKKKKKKQKLIDNSEENYIASYNTMHQSASSEGAAEEDISTESVNKKKKKKKGQTDTMVHPSNDETNWSSTSMSKEEKKTKKNKRKMDHSDEISGKSLEQENEINNEFNSDQDSNHSGIPRKVSKKERDSKIEFDSNQETNLVDAGKKKKKKKKKINGEIASVPHDSDAQNGQIDSSNLESKTEVSESKTNKNLKRKNIDNNSSHKHVGKKARKNNEQGDGNKKKHKKWNQNRKDEETISDARLRAYGIHPKKFRNKMKYGPQS